jgi:hypothetical protein
VPEGLSPSEVSKEIVEHTERARLTPEQESRYDRLLSITEALILSLVAVLAAYSGYAAAKWSTDSAVAIARASGMQAQANRFDAEAIVTRTLDSVSFDTWFTAFVAGHHRAEALAARRFRSGYRPAFNSWLATDPLHNPNAPPGPSYMPNYRISQANEAQVDDTKAEDFFTEGTHAGATADDYIRVTVFLATVLFLVGIGGHFRIRQARWALIAVGTLLLVFSVIQLTGLPEPPG